MNRGDAGIAFRGAPKIVVNDKDTLGGIEGKGQAEATVACAFLVKEISGVTDEVYFNDFDGIESRNNILLVMMSLANSKGRLHSRVLDVEIPCVFEMLGKRINESLGGLVRPVEGVENLEVIRGLRQDFVVVIFDRASFAGG